MVKIHSFNYVNHLDEFKFIFSRRFVRFFWVININNRVIATHIVFLHSITVFDPPGLQSLEKVKSHKDGIFCDCMVSLCWHACCRCSRISCTELLTVNSFAPVSAHNYNHLFHSPQQLLTVISFPQYLHATYCILHSFYQLFDLFTLVHDNFSMARPVSGSHFNHYVRMSHFLRVFFFCSAGALFRGS